MIGISEPKSLKKGFLKALSDTLKYPTGGKENSADIDEGWLYCYESNCWLHFLGQKMTCFSKSCTSPRTASFSPLNINLFPSPSCNVCCLHNNITIEQKNHQKASTYYRMTYSNVRFRPRGNCLLLRRTINNSRNREAN